MNTLTNTAIHSNNKDASDLAILLSYLQTAFKLINSKLRKSKCDATVLNYANEVLLSQLAASARVSCVLTILKDEPVLTENRKQGKYVVHINPLDNIQNIEQGMAMSSLFTIFRRKSKDSEQITQQDYFQSFDEIVTSGYCIYASYTELVISIDNQVIRFALDQNIGEFIELQKSVKIPSKGSIYSINEGYQQLWEETMLRFILDLKQTQDYNLRYNGACAIDFHRVLMNGGLFLYPSDLRQPSGRLELLFHIFPLANIVKVAGGQSLVGTFASGFQSLEQIEVNEVHKKYPFQIGSGFEISKLKEFI